MSVLTTRERADAPVLPFNRKYLGSKRQLREWMADRMCEVAGTPADLPRRLLRHRRGERGHGAARGGADRAVDTLRSNCVILRGFTAPCPRIAALLDHVNAVPPMEGYIDSNYSGTYFTAENCRRMDGMREEIERLRARR